jgi:hypothetical protein
VPGILPRLAVVAKCDIGGEVYASSNMFIVAGDVSNNMISRDKVWRIKLFQRRLEELLRSVTVLQVHVVYPYWKIQSYHGLTELRLTCSHNWPVSITELELASILKPSLGLRMLSFSLNVLYANMTMQGPVS